VGGVASFILWGAFKGLVAAAVAFYSKPLFLKLELLANAALGAREPRLLSGRR